MKNDVPAPVGQSFLVNPEQAGLTLAAFLRVLQPGQSWNQIRRLIETRRVRVNDELCLDAVRRLHDNETVAVLPRPDVPPRDRESINLRHADAHVVVVEKPSGLATMRHPSERDWTAKRKSLHPTLEDLVPPILAKREGRQRKGTLPRLRIVHRLDKETSGLIVFARTVLGERELGKQFRTHTVWRHYLAIVPGRVTSQRIANRLVRDRGDGRRGSTNNPKLGKEAVTLIEVVEHLPGYSLISCRLQTGRTHQIRIHLAELGHPICGEKVYQRGISEKTAPPDPSGAPRLALHAAELGFRHPQTRAKLRWEMPLPADLQGFLDRLRAGK